MKEHSITMQKTADRAEKNAKELRSQLEQAKRDKVDQEKIKQYESEISRLEDTQARATEMIVNYKKERQKYESAIEKYGADANVTQSNLQKMTAENEQLKTKLSELEITSRSAIQRADTLTKQEQETVRHLKQENQTIKNNMQTLINENQSLKSHLTTINQQNLAAVAAADELHLQSQNYDRQMQLLQQQYENEFQRQIHSMNQDKKSAIDALHEHYATVIDEYKSDINQLTDKNTAGFNEYNRLIGIHRETHEESNRQKKIIEEQKNIQ
jgi:chromosome segregation ATPase